MKWLTPYKGIIIAVVLAGIMGIIAIRFNDVLAIISALIEALVPFIIGAILAFVLDILVQQFERLWRRIFPSKGYTNLERLVSIILSLVTIIVVISFIGRMAIPQLIHSLGIIVNSLPVLYTDTMRWVTMHISGIQVGNNITVADSISTESIIEQVRTWGTQGGRYIVSTMGSAVTWFINFVIGLIFAIYILLDKERLTYQFSKLFRAYLPDTMVGKMSHIVSVGSDTFSKFFVGQFLDAVILGTLVGVALAIFQVSYASTIGCVIGLTALVPMVGAYVGGIMGLLMVLTVSPMEALVYLIILVVMQQVEGNFIYPRIVGGSVGLPGLWVFASVTIGGALFGIVGMLLSVPLTATIYKLLREDVNRRLHTNIE